MFLLICQLIAARLTGSRCGGAFEEVSGGRTAGCFSSGEGCCIMLRLSSASAWRGIAKPGFACFG